MGTVMIKERDDEPASGDDLLTVEEAMASLKCGKTKIYSLGKEGRLELVKFDRATRVTRESVETLLREIKRNPKVMSS